MWDENTYPFPNFNGCTVQVWEYIRNLTPHLIMDVVTYPCGNSSYSVLAIWAPDLSLYCNIASKPSPSFNDHSNIVMSCGEMSLFENQPKDSKMQCVCHWVESQNDLCGLILPLYNTLIHWPVLFYRFRVQCEYSSSSCIDYISPIRPFPSRIKRTIENFAETCVICIQQLLMFSCFVVLSQNTKLY